MRCLLTASLLCAALAQVPEVPDPPVLPSEISDYIVILDAGSTGTRAQAFHYPQRVLRQGTRDFVVSRPLTLPKPLFFVDTVPGISSFRNDPSGLYHYLLVFAEKVAKRLKKHDDKKNLAEVPIYLGATAGMRNLDEAARQRLFTPIREALHASPFSFGTSLHARVLSGEEEAAYGWLTANYYHGEISADPAETFGSLDMGGESTEVAFIPRDNSIMAGLFPMHFGVLPGAIHLYVHSYMHFGYISAFQNATTHLLHESTGNSLEHPCLPRGLDWQVQEGAFGFATDGRAERTHGPLTLKGTSDFGRCEESAARLVVKAPCSQSPCSFLGVYQPSLKGSRFYVSGELAKALRLLAPAGSPGPPLQALRAAARELCAQPLGEQAHHLAKLGWPKDAEPELACFLACWVRAFLIHGLGFEANTTSLMVESRKQDWPQGAAIYHVNFFPYRVALGMDGEQHHTSARTEVELSSQLHGVEIDFMNASSNEAEVELSSQLQGEEIDFMNATSDEVLLRASKHFKTAVRKHLKKERKHMLAEKVRELELMAELKKVTARLQKRQRKVQKLEMLLQKKHAAGHGHHSGGGAKAAPQPSAALTTAADLVALASAAVLSGACLATMAACTGQGWQRRAREPLLAK